MKLYTRILTWIAPFPVWDELRFHVKLAFAECYIRIGGRPKRPVSYRRVHLGCGHRVIDGWCNIDINANADLWANLRHNLRLPSCSAEVIHMEHVLEHFTWDDAQRLLRECKRILMPGGVLRVIVPDGEKLMKWYCSRNVEALRQIYPESKTPMIAINAAFRQGWQHKFVYDFETLSLALEAAGFAREGIRKCRYMSGQAAEIIDGAERKHESLYVEAIKR